MISAIVCAPGRIRRHRGSSTPRLPSQFWLGDLHAIGLIFRYAYDGPAEREYHPALWPSRSTDSGQRRGWSSVCRATRPRPAPEVRSTRHRRLGCSAHVPPFSKDQRLRTCRPKCFIRCSARFGQKSSVPREPAFTTGTYSTFAVGLPALYLPGLCPAVHGEN
jgi:hypothetical protein